jgi:predicted amino acid-binding ACT domain protein
MNPVLPHLQQIRTTLLELAHVGKNDVHHDPVATSFVTQRNVLKMKPETGHIDRDNPHVGIQDRPPDSSLRVPVSNRRRHRHEERIVQRSMLSVLMNQQQKEEEDSQQSHEASTASTQQRQHERPLHNSGSSAPQSCLGKSHQPRSPPPKIDLPVPGVPMPRRMRSAVNVMQQRHRTLEDEMMERLQQVKMMELSNTNDSSSSNGGGGGGIGGGYCSRGGQSSNEARKSRRAQHHRAIIHDLTEIVSDLFLAESKLVNPSLYGVQPDHDLRLQREQVSKCVQDFILSLPPRYALGVESPSEVLIHMRLMAAVRADPSRPTVHIANLDDDAHWMSASSSIATTFKAESESASGKLHTNNSQRKRLVTICCTDQHGLLEYISRILATSGSRVLDADVMLSSDSIALDRFVVEMNGRLRLDRLAQYVGEFLEQQKEKKGLQTSEQIKEGDAFPDASEPVAKPDLPGSLYFRHNSILPVRRCLSSMDIVRGIPLRQALKEQTGSSRNLLSSLDSNESFVPLTRSQTMLPTSSTSNNKFVPTTSRLLTKSEISAKVQEMTADPGLDDIRGSVSSETSNPPDDNSNEKVQIRPLIKRRGISDFDAVGPFRLTEALKNDASHNPATKGLEKRNIPMIPFDELMLIETLGVGRVSTIYRAAWRPNPQSADGSEDVQMLALKVAMVNPETHDTSHINELHREFEIAACLQHPNISHLVGIAEDHE